MSNFYSDNPNALPDEVNTSPIFYGPPGVKDRTDPARNAISQALFDIRAQLTVVSNALGISASGVAFLKLKDAATSATVYAYVSDGEIVLDSNPPA